MREIKIDDRIVGDNHPVYVIAEIGLNHQGDINIAKILIDKAVEAGVDCVKFQKRSLKNLYSSIVLNTLSQQEHGIHYSLHHIQKTELSDVDMAFLYEYSKSKNVDFLCTPWDIESLFFLEKLGVHAFKIASADLFNLRLIGQAAGFKKPLIISTGMSFVSEIEQVVDFLNKINASYALLHCNSTYPAPYNDINLNFIKTLREKFNCPIGYSGHEAGTSVSLAAVALGARIIEKHITLDRQQEGPDHRASLLPEEFIELVRQIRIIEMSLGDTTRFPSRGEYLNRETLSKSLVAARDLKKGTVLTYDDIDLKSPGKGTSPLKLDLFVGKTLAERDLKRDDYLLESDVHLSKHDVPIISSGKRKWGVVARMGDIDTMIKCGSDFIEIHLTDSDINENKEYSKEYATDLVVHGPEYNGDLLLNLSSTDPITRKKSIEFFNKALAHARNLKRLFRNKNDRVKFIVHPGGMDINKPRVDLIEVHNKNFLDSLKQLNSDGFELLLENMPTCAWYFGGQQYQSNFMDAKEIVNFARAHGYSLTFDTSHAALYCNYFKKDLLEYAETILPLVRYLHISDAAHLNGEGLQIGDGGIDFSSLLKKIESTDAWYLPEIWQGHKFGGEGYLKAVKKLREFNSNF
ncbi:MAG: N-acetylneuraminate synthase family protein [Candidatus Roizmanbacteria bacterium]|nr:N-acetylneuraminate synthase family protein [Candidatus Roizmanbacteria bacterium]